jgi:hypothetical protein
VAVVAGNHVTRLRVAHRGHGPEVACYVDALVAPRQAVANQPRTIVAVRADRSPYVRQAQARPRAAHSIAAATGTRA